MGIGLDGSFGSMARIAMAFPPGFWRTLCIYIRQQRYHVEYSERKYTNASIEQTYVSNFSQS